MAAFGWQQVRSCTLKSRDLNCFTKFRGVPNHIRVLMYLFSSCPLLYSKFHRSSVVPVLPWGLTFISKFLGVGLNFHDFNESKQPCIAGIKRLLSLSLRYSKRRHAANQREQKVYCTWNCCRQCDCTFLFRHYLCLSPVHKQTDYKPPEIYRL